jgi:Flp pilus assembly protein TadD
MPEQSGAGELVIERLAWERALPTLRLSRAFQAAAGSDSPNRRFTVGDGMHPNAEGCRVAAEALAAALADPSLAELRAAPAAGTRAEEVARDLGARATDYSGVWNEKGVAALEAGDAATAVEHFRQALDENPASRTALYNLGLVAYRQGDFAGAEAWLVRSLAVEPRDVDALEILGVALAQQGRLDEARARLEEALGVDPGRASLRANLAEVEARRLREGR